MSQPQTGGSEPHPDVQKFKAVFAELLSQDRKPLKATGRSPTDRLETDHSGVVLATWQAERAAVATAAALPANAIAQRQPRQLQTFDMAEFLQRETRDLLTAESPDKDALAGLLKQAAERIDAQVRGQPDDDATFDLMLKTKTELMDDIAKALGIPTPDEVVPSPLAVGKTGGMLGGLLAKLKPPEPGPVQKMAETMQEAARAAFPNKVADGKLTLGDEEYGQPKALGKGANGLATRYTDASGGTVVAKSCLQSGPLERKAFADDLRMHRLATKGGHGNVLPLLGVAIDEKGNPLSLMPEAKAGDLDGFMKGIAAAAGAGVLPPAAQMALTQDVVRQTATGMQHLHESNLAHYDMKGGNCLVMEDGTVKIADFGTSRVTDATGKLPTAPGNAGQFRDGETLVTKTFAAPETQIPGAASDKADSFSLGAMFDMLVRGQPSTQQIPDKDGTYAERAEGKKGEPTKDPSTLGAIKERMLATDPAARPDPKQILAALDAMPEPADPAAVKALRDAVTAYIVAARAALADDLAQREAAIEALSDEAAEIRSALERSIAEKRAAIETMEDDIRALEESDSSSDSESDNEEDEKVAAQDGSASGDEDDGPDEKVEALEESSSSDDEKDGNEEAQEESSSDENEAKVAALRDRLAVLQAERKELKAKLTESETTGDIAELKKARGGLEEKQDQVKAAGVAGQNGRPDIKMLLEKVQTASIPFGARKPEGLD